MGALSERSKIRLGLIRTSRSIPRDGRGTSNFLKNPFPQLKWAFFSCPTTKPFSVAPSLEPNSPRSLPRRLQRGPSARFRLHKNRQNVALPDGVHRPVFPLSCGVGSQCIAGAAFCYSRVSESRGPSKAFKRVACP